jgi:hypothetical protein
MNLLFASEVSVEGGDEMKDDIFEEEGEVRAGEQGEVDVLMRRCYCSCADVAPGTCRGLGMTFPFSLLGVLRSGEYGSQQVEELNFTLRCQYE